MTSTMEIGDQEKGLPESWSVARTGHPALREGVCTL